MKLFIESFQDVLDLRSRRKSAMKTILTILCFLSAEVCNSFVPFGLGCQVGNFGEVSGIQFVQLTSGNFDIDGFEDRF